MFAMEDQNAFGDFKPAPLLFVLPEPAEDYGWLVREFEETAQVLLARVERALEEVARDHRAVTGKDWRREALFLAAELTRSPWLLVNTACPPKYENLKLFYRAWAVACGELQSCLRTLVRKDDRRPVDIRAAYAQEAFSVVTAYTAARITYLKRLALATASL
jgi:hypothetical protein